jgi:ammonia channel protein AmtB
MVGNLLTGLFAQKSIAGSDGSPPINGGWLDHHYIQLAYQAADSAAGFSYSFVVTVNTSNRYPGVFHVSLTAFAADDHPLGNGHLPMAPPQSRRGI